MYKHQLSYAFNFIHTFAKPLQVVADLSKDEDVAMMIATIISAFQRIDVLINNAGVLSMTNIFDPNFMESFDNVHRTNLRSVLLVTHLAVPYLVKSKGNIINVSSIASTMPVSLLFTAEPPSRILKMFLTISRPN